MANQRKTLIEDIEEFLALTGMGPTYFGKASTGNSELVNRLRSGRRVWPETEEKIRLFMEKRTAKEPAK